MAEFKLGRIRFVWKGAWVSATTYYKDDVVRFGGKVYICQAGHSAAIDFNTDLDISPSKWNLMSDGQRWSGDWETDTVYQEGDLVKYGGTIYICVDGHTSAISSALGLEADLNFGDSTLSKWDTFAEGVEWKNDWTISTRYKFNDIVRYGGINYICITGHTSAATVSDGLEINSANWQVFTQGQEYLGTWTNSIRYKINDVVKYGAGQWICTTEHTSTSSFTTDSANWAQYVEGFEFEGLWTSLVSYQQGDVVSYGGNRYIAKTLNLNANPLTSSSDWDLFSEGLSYQADWTNATSYKIGQVVKLNGYNYLAVADSPSNAYSITAVDGPTDVFTTADTSGMVSGMSVRFTGTTFGNVFPTARYYIKDVLDGTTFTISDIYGGTLFNADAGTGTMTATVSAEPPHSLYWAPLNNGIFWKGAWVDDVEYNAGDAVKQGPNSYICILAHRSEGDDGSSIKAEGGGAANSRPDLDALGIYWNIIASGSETSVLTTLGDMVYYGGAGPTRLPVGTEGQLLRVSADGIPEWVTWGDTDHVYYVGNSGADRPYPDHGATIDTPWASIRYACEQVEKGARNPNAKHLLELNRVFIQKEVTSWIDYQIDYYTNVDATPASVWYQFDYDESKCERDVGFVVDRIIWDITHGGNLKTLSAALSYVNLLSGADLFATVDEDNGTGTYSRLGAESDQDVAAYNYALEVMTAVLANTAPATVYQNITDDSVAIVEQYTNALYTQEPSVLSDVTTLVGIITTALADQNADNLPARRVPNNTINVKTGRYRETLPIIVPAETCVIGDEVRSVNAGPASSLISRDDAKYSLGVLGRLETVLGQIILGTDVTETSGNTATQSAEFPFASSLQVADLQRLVRATSQQIDFKLGTLHLSSSADPVDYNTASFLEGYGDARRLLKENKEFIKSEITAWITENYPDLKYSRTACRRDVGYIVDAIAYDLTYGGSQQTLVAGLAYFDGNASATLMIDNTEVGGTVAAYGRMKTVIQQLIANTTVVKTTGNNAVQWTDATNLTNGANADTKVSDLVDIIINIIEGDSTRSLTPQINVITIAGTTTFTSTGHTLEVGDAVIPRISANGLVQGVKYWVAAIATNTFTLAATYGGAALTTFTNGAGLDIDLETIDYPTATDGVTSTTALITAAQTLDAAQETIVQNVIDDLNAVAWHTDFVVSATTLTNDDFVIYVGKHTLAHTYVSGGIVTLADATTKTVSNFVYNEATGFATVTTSTDHGLAAGDIVNITDITVSCASAGGGLYNAVFPSATKTDGTTLKIQYLQHKCIRDVRLILEAVMYDFMFNSNFQSIKSAYSYLRASAVDVFVGNQKTITRDALINAKTEAIANVGGNATAQARIETLMTTIDDIIYGATNEGSLCQTELRDADYARLQLERNRAFIIAEITAWGTDTYSDTVTDTNSVGNVITISDTSWLQRNAAIRFVGTVFGGLETGTTYYVQNVVDSTTFTIGLTRNTNNTIALITSSGSLRVELFYNNVSCERDVGRYIDAFKFDLQYPGNYESRLAARYYANAVLGSLEEDMFYLRNGTGIRNMTLAGLTGDMLPENEYGTSRVSAGAYASLDPGWGPADFRTWIISRSPYVQNVCTFGNAAVGQKIDGALHNGGNKSIVSNDFTQIISDGIGAWVTNNARAELVSVFSYYSHIGYLSENGGRIRGTNGNNSYGDFGSVAEGFDSNETPILCQVDNRAYTVAIGSVLTDGIDEVLNFEFDNAGTDYTEAAWSITGGGAGVQVEQRDFRDGAVFQIRLIDNVDDSAASPESAGNYGGFGYVSNANTAQSGTTTAITIAAVDDEISLAYVGMVVLVTGGTGAGQFGIIDTYNAATKIANVLKESTGGAGWDHFVPGTTIVAPDASSTYVVEPRVAFTAPTYASSARTLATTAVFNDVSYAKLFKVYQSLTGTTNSIEGAGAVFTVVRKGTKYLSVQDTNTGTGYARLDTITIPGTDLNGTSTTNDITITITSVNADTGAIQAFEFIGRGAGGNFVAITSGSRTINTSADGQTWTERTLALPSTSNWVAAASGKLTIIESAAAFITGRSYVIATLGNTVFTSIGAPRNLVGEYFVATGAGSGSGTATPVSEHLVAVSSSTTVNAYSQDGGITWTAGGGLPAAMSGSTVDVVYGTENQIGTWLAIAANGKTAYTTTGGITWVAGGDLPAGTWTSVAYGGGVFVAVSTGATTAAYSSNGGESWTSANLPASSTWIDVVYGKNKFLAVSSSGAVNPAYSIDGITWSSTGETGWLNQTITAVSYGQGAFVSVNSSSNNAVSSDDGIVWTTRALTRSSGTGFGAIVFGNPNQSGIWTFMPSASTAAASSALIGATAKARAFVADQKVYAIRVTDPGSGYATAPTITITDSSALYEVPTQVRIGNGAIGRVDFLNRGAGYDSAFAELDGGDGYADEFQNGQFLAVKRLTGIPSAGANVVLDSQTGFVYKLVNVLSQSGEFDGGRAAFFQLSPTMSVFNSPADGTQITTRIRYSQVRLTGHDFLDIGTGSFTETNYPNTPTQPALQVNETADLNGGRVFYTSTDQDGNFRVGELFVIEQATGRATLNADAFNIAGLTELSLGNITLGGNSATITEFSTDPFLTANSDSVVSTQRAIKAYIAAQIGGGGASLNVNSIVAGFVEIAGTRITTTTGGTIQMKANFNFTAGVRGLPISWNYFLNN